MSSVAVSHRTNILTFHSNTEEKSQIQFCNYKYVAVRCFLYTVHAERASESLILPPRFQDLSTFCSSKPSETKALVKGTRCFSLVAINFRRYPRGRRQCGRCVFLWIRGVPMPLWLSLLSIIFPDREVSSRPRSRYGVCQGSSMTKEKSPALQEHTAKPALTLALFFYLPFYIIAQLTAADRAPERHHRNPLFSFPGF